MTTPRPSQSFNAAAAALGEFNSTTSNFLVQRPSEGALPNCQSTKGRVEESGGSRVQKFHCGLGESFTKALKGRFCSP